MLKGSLNLPNTLTSMRLLVSPVIAYFLLLDSVFSCYIVLGLVLFCEMTDLADGYMARKHGLVTDLGKLLDPMADSIYRDTIFLSLAVSHQVSLFLVLPILYRDSIIQTLRTVCAHRGIVLAARWSGKIKAVVQAVIIIAIIILRIFGASNEMLGQQIYLINNILMGIACSVTVISAIDYMKAQLPLIMNDLNS
jgi:CDP-diacylglycerol--glycerol-3-phosphate 3-phosphatidyltransferase